MNNQVWKMFCAAKCGTHVSNKHVNDIKGGFFYHVFGDLWVQGRKTLSFDQLRVWDDVNLPETGRHQL